MSIYRRLSEIERIATSREAKYSIRSSHKIGASCGVVEITNLETMKNETRYVLHETIIVSRKGDIVTLNFGGWKTPTTRKFMGIAMRIEGIDGDIYSYKGTQCLRLSSKKDNYISYCFPDQTCEINTRLKTVNLPKYENYIPLMNKKNKW
jgi:hypothetical protein